MSDGEFPNTASSIRFVSPKRFCKFSSGLGYYGGLFIIPVYNLFGAKIERSEIPPLTPEGWIS